MATSYSPGEVVPYSGIYWVTHDAGHKSKHEVTCIKGKKFPPCSACSGGARFRLRSKAKHVGDHKLFRK